MQQQQQPVQSISQHSFRNLEQQPQQQQPTVARRQPPPPIPQDRVSSQSSVNRQIEQPTTSNLTSSSYVNRINPQYHIDDQQQQLQQQQQQVIYPRGSQPQTTTSSSQPNSQQASYHGSSQGSQHSSQHGSQQGSIRQGATSQQQLQQQSVISTTTQQFVREFESSRSTSITSTPEINRVKKQVVVNEQVNHKDVRIIIGDTRILSYFYSIFLF